MSTEAETIDGDWILPVDASGWDGDLECLILYDLTFKEEWGPWKKGAKLDSVAIDLVKKTVSVFDDDGKLLTQVPFKLVPNTDP